MIILKRVHDRIPQLVKISDPVLLPYLELVAALVALWVKGTSHRRCVQRLMDIA